MVRSICFPLFATRSHARIKRGRIQMSLRGTPRPLYYTLQENVSSSLVSGVRVVHSDWGINHNIFCRLPPTSRAFTRLFRDSKLSPFPWLVRCLLPLASTPTREMIRVLQAQQKLIAVKNAYHIKQFLRNLIAKSGPKLGGNSSRPSPG